jgi:hypothetical protein
MVRVSLHPPRCYLAGLRVHHGLTGLVLVAAGLLSHRRGLFALGAVLVAEDFSDWPWSLFDAH